MCPMTYEQVALGVSRISCSYAYQHYPSAWAELVDLVVDRLLSDYDLTTLEVDLAINGNQKKAVHQLWNDELEEGESNCLSGYHSVIWKRLQIWCGTAHLWRAGCLRYY